MKPSKRNNEIRFRPTPQMRTLLDDAEKAGVPARFILNYSAERLDTSIRVPPEMIKITNPQLAGRFFREPLCKLAENPHLIFDRDDSAGVPGCRMVYDPYSGEGGDEYRIFVRNGRKKFRQVSFEEAKAWIVKELAVDTGQDDDYVIDVESVLNLVGFKM